MKGTGNRRKRMMWLKLENDKNRETEKHKASNGKECEKKKQ